MSIYRKVRKICMKEQERIMIKRGYHSGVILKVICLKLIVIFRCGVQSSRRYCSCATRVARMFSWRMKMSAKPFRHSTCHKDWLFARDF